MTTTAFGSSALSAAVPPPLRPGPPLPPAIARAAVRQSEQARRSPITHVRYVALATEDLAATVAFYQGIWDLYPVSGGDVYSCFTGPDNFVVEYTTALERIIDEDAWVPRVWPASPEYADRWGTAGPGEDLFALWHRTPPESGATGPGTGLRRAE